MKKALVYRWKAYNQRDVEEALQNAGIELTFFDLAYKSMDEDDVFEEKVVRLLREDSFDFVFSINYFTILSNACERVGMPYISWLCDSRLLTMHNNSVFNACNRIFVFDRVDYAEFRRLGARVFYLPLAANVARMDRVRKSSVANVSGVDMAQPANGSGTGAVQTANESSAGEMQDAEGSSHKYSVEISFVGSMYAKKNEYDKCKGELTPYLQGYFDAALRAQTDVYGEDVIGELLTDDIVLKLGACLSFEKAKESFSSLPLAFAVTHLGFKLANIERTKLLTLLAGHFPVALYSDAPLPDAAGIDYRGTVDYWTQMPKVFYNSRINLNVTMRNIRTGLPLRMFDIMGCEGFLLTNYQAEIASLFEPGRDLVVYESFDDCLKKAGYYLEHEDERRTIAENGYRKICAHHTYDHRIAEMFEILKRENCQI